MSLKKNPKRVLIVDDHPLLRQGIGELINQQPDLMVCGEADEARLVIAAIKNTKPDIIIMDISLKGTSGIEALKDVKAQFPEARVLVLSMHDEAVFAPRVLRAGALGYVMKHEAPDKVLTALRTIAKNEIFVSERLGARLLSGLAGGHHSPSASPIDRLSDRELEVFTLLGQGMSTRDIAERLHLSVKTIESHRAHIKEKLGIENAAELIHHAIQWVQSEAFTTSRNVAMAA